MIYSIVPSRSGSKAIPNKNIKLIKGIPLFAYSVLISNQSSKIKECIFTTDSEEYIKLARKYKCKIIKRPEFLSNDNAGDIDYILHIIYKLEFNPEDLIILLRPTTPLRKLEILEKAINEFIKSDFTSLRSVHKTNEPPEKMFKFKNKQEIVPYINIDAEQANLPRQNFNSCYHPNGYIDIIKVSYVLQNKTLWGNKIMGYITPQIIEIDSVEDLKYFEYKMELQSGIK